MKILITILILLVIIIGGCTTTTSNDTELFKKQTAENTCIDICNLSKDALGLNNGPCLSDDNSDWKIDDWVCDVAHSPRQPIDDLPENQCSAYREGVATHFVEVDPNCNLIRAV